MPITDSIRARLAVVSKKRDGTTHNIHTGNDFNDINAWGARFSLDWDIGDNTVLKTYHRTLMREMTIEPISVLFIVLLILCMVVIHLNEVSLMLHQIQEVVLLHYLI